MNESMNPQTAPTAPNNAPNLVGRGLEEVLQEMGVLTPAQVADLKVESLNAGVSAESLIVSRRLVPPDKLVEARAQSLGIPFIKLTGKSIPPEVLNYIPEGVARRYKLIPFRKDLDAIEVAMVDPLDFQVLQFLEKKTGLNIKRYIAVESDIQSAINAEYSQNLTNEVASALREVAPTEAVQAAQSEQAEVIREAPVTNIVNQLIDYAIKSHASDIHMEPEESQTRVRYRIDGILHEKIILPRKVHDAVVSRVKILSNLKIDERRLPQDGRFSYSSGGEDIDLRVSTLPTVYGEKVVLRLLPKSQKAPTLQELGIRAVSLRSLETQLLRPHGIVLICGPTGSGKTTTLYAILSKLSTTKVNILTVEDPVEYQIPGANQVQVNQAVGLTFATALRSFLRQDPNIMLVGEIRDTETADLAVQAALTGHQVFSTLHTNSAAGALPRLLDMGEEPFLVTSAINAAVGQRILRKVCTFCRVAYVPPVEVVDNIRSVLGPLMPNKPNIQLYKGKGCPNCGMSGYQGRSGIYEVLTMTDKIVKLVLSRASTADIERQAIEEGMVTMKQDGYLKALEGVTTLEEVLRVAQD